jgi:hypothetical protein
MMGSDHDLDAHELQRDIGHGGYYARDGYRERQPAIAEAAAHEVPGRNVAPLAADVP